MSPAPRPPAPLPPEFFAQPTRRLARALIGTFLVHALEGVLLAGRVVETEAYLGARDPAAHSFRGMTARNRTMFGAPGHLYVYFIYGMHHCCNVVSMPAGTGEAVLLRALEPVVGLDAMRARRGGAPLRDLCRGPARLVEALGIGREHDGALLAAPPLYLAARDAFGRGRWPMRPRVVTDVRVGIRAAADLRLRFLDAGSPFVSRPPARNEGGPQRAREP